jgi:hypothetical protein
METPYRIKPTPNYLDCGIAALQRHDYESAIAILTWLSQRYPGAMAERLQAQMYLVMAHEAVQNWGAAIDLARRLTRCDEDRVRDWAFQVLPVLTDKAGIQETTTPNPFPRLEIYSSSPSAQPIKVRCTNPPQPQSKSSDAERPSMTIRILNRIRACVVPRLVPQPTLAQ